MADELKNLEDEIKSIVANILEIDPAKITPDARFVEDLGMDSIMALEILVALEKKYKIKIPEESLRRIITLEEAMTLAREYMSERQNIGLCGDRNEQ